MADKDRASDDPQLAAIARHALHDEELIAAFAAGDVDEAADTERARSLVERCGTCRDLHRDLAAIRNATRASGSAQERAATRRAPRDFRLTTEDAARLRRGPPVARLAGGPDWRSRLANGVVAFGRPVGAAMATFGVVGLLVGSLSLGGAPFAATGGATGATGAPGTDQTGAAPEASAIRGSVGPSATVKGGSAEGGIPGGRDLRGGGTFALLVGSVVLVTAGIVLIVLSRRDRTVISAGRGN